MAVLLLIFVFRSRLLTLHACKCLQRFEIEHDFFAFFGLIGFLGFLASFDVLALRRMDCEQAFVVDGQLLFFCLLFTWLVSGDVLFENGDCALGLFLDCVLR